MVQNHSPFAGAARHLARECGEWWRGGESKKTLFLALENYSQVEKYYNSLFYT